MTFFRSEMTTPPFGNFPKIHPFWQRQASLGLEMLANLTKDATNSSRNKYVLERGVCTGTAYPR